jgi:protein-disulfide isomerase
VQTQEAVGEIKAGDLEAVAPIDATDHVRGDANAPLTIVEYSDTECPFCKRFHATMKEVLQAYPGKVKWVYRHFPLEQLHAKAMKEAQATECVQKLGGTTAFWSFLDSIYDITPSNDGLDLAKLPVLAEKAGVDRAQFEACIASDEGKAKVQKDLENAIATGGTGTPWSILITADGAKYPINGAQPLENLKQIIDAALQAPR